MPKNKKLQLNKLTISNFVTRPEAEKVRGGGTWTICKTCGFECWTVYCRTQYDTCGTCVTDCAPCTTDPDTDPDPDTGGTGGTGGTTGQRTC